MIKTLEFSTPIYHVEKYEWLHLLKKVSNEYVLNMKRKIKNKQLEYGYVYRTENYFNDMRIKDVTNFIKNKCYEILDEWGYDTKNYRLLFNEFWTNKFTNDGGCHIETHAHPNNHISGFYFLEICDETTQPHFVDPRPFQHLVYKNENDLTLGSQSVYFKCKPGTFLFFPSYLQHFFPVHKGVKNFSFIHFNVQAIHNNIFNNK